MSTKPTKISEVAARMATPEKVHQADDTRGRGSMVDVEKTHGTAPGASDAAKAAKAKKQRINPEAFGVEVETPAEAPPAPTKGDKDGKGKDK